MSAAAYLTPGSNISVDVLCVVLSIGGGLNKIPGWKFSGYVPRHHHYLSQPGGSSR
jgi:hypothetical protein